MGDRGPERYVLNMDFCLGPIRPTIRILSMADNKMGGINGTLYIRDNSCYYYGYIVAFLTAVRVAGDFIRTKGFLWKFLDFLIDIVTRV